MIRSHRPVYTAIILRKINGNTHKIFILTHDITGVYNIKNDIRMNASRDYVLQSIETLDTVE